MGNKPAARKAGQAVDVQRAFFRRRADPSRSVVERIEGARQGQKQFLSRVRQTESVVGPSDDGGSQILFEQTDLMTDSRRGDVQFVRGSFDAPEAANSLERAQRR